MDTNYEKASSDSVFKRAANLLQKMQESVGKEEFFKMLTYYMVFGGDPKYMKRCLLSYYIKENISKK